VRYLAVPLIVLIIGLVFLLYVWTDRRRKVRAAELREARGQRDQAIAALQEVKKEVEAQVAAYPQLFFLEEMLRQKLTIVTERKELTR
jgi:type II secretory pathway pseudopilin PulG